MIRVLIADDHRVVRAGLQALLDGEDDFEVVGAAVDGAEAVRLAGELSPDVVLMDLSMPVVDGVEATRRILDHDPAAIVVVLTSFADREQVLAAINAGAVGYLLKDAEPAEVFSAVRAAARGDSPLDPRAARVILSARTSAPNAADGLTAREREVLTLVAEGLANKQIARRLGISEKTVKTHLTNVFQQIGVTDRTQAAVWLLRNGPV
jgi:DNA-binding NarL/FixJ family response regulator